MKKMKSWLATILSVAMVFSFTVAPGISAVAAEADEMEDAEIEVYAEITEEEKSNVVNAEETTYLEGEIGEAGDTVVGDDTTAEAEAEVSESDEIEVHAEITEEENSNVVNAEETTDLEGEISEAGGTAVGDDNTPEVEAEVSESDEEASDDTTRIDEPAFINDVYALTSENDTSDMEAFAVYYSSENSLTFYTDISVPTAGELYNGKAVTNVYTDVDSLDATGMDEIPWYSLRTSITDVVIDESFADVQPISLAYWFYDMTNASFTGLENIDTSNVMTLEKTFYNCSGIKELDVSKWDTAKVTNMQYMFYGCSELTTIYSDDYVFVTDAVKNGDYMFQNCSSLVGGSGTKYDSSNDTYTMAHVDTEDNPGYLTEYKSDNQELTVYSELWDYETGPVQTVTVEKIWIDSDGNVIENGHVIKDEYGINGIEVGLFDALGEAVEATEDTEGVFGYTKGTSEDGSTTYTVTYEDDNGIYHQYIYTAANEEEKKGASLTYTQWYYDADGNLVEDGPVTYTEIDASGRILDDENDYVIAWLENVDGQETLYIRVDEQTLNADNDWYYAWEILDPDGNYEVLELETYNPRYDTTITKEELKSYKYWSIIGDDEIEESLENGGTLRVILTEGAQEADDTLGDTKDAMGWVIVATEDGITTKQVEFSQIGTLDHDDDSDNWQSVEGVTTQSEIEKLGSGAVWYIEDAHTTAEDVTGSDVECFYLYCWLHGEKYYLAVNEAMNGLIVTTDSSSASEFYYNSLGELTVSVSYYVEDEENGDYECVDDEYVYVGEGFGDWKKVENTARVTIDSDGSIVIEEGGSEASADDVRIYTLKETATTGYAFSILNAFTDGMDFVLKKVDGSDTSITLSGAEFVLTNSEGLYYYYIYDDYFGGRTYWVPERDIDENEYWDDVVLVTDENGQITLHDLPDGVYTLTEVKAPTGYVLSQTPIIITISEGSVTIDGDNTYVEGGIKYLTDEDVFTPIICITNTLLPGPKIIKEIAEDDYERKEESGTDMHDGENTYGDGWGSWDDADNNQKVTYHITLTDIKDAMNITVHDYLEEGLDFEHEVEVVLYDGDTKTALTEYDYTMTETEYDYTMTETDCSDPNECAMEGCTFEVKFEDSVFEGISSEAYIVITYQALTDTHEKDYDDYVDEILNYSYMTYGVSSYRSSIVTTATDLFGFGVYKYADEDGTEQALSGAEFVLERGGVYAAFDVETDADTGEVYYMVSGWAGDIGSSGILSSYADGMIRIEGLDDDTYTITETKAPDGYEIVDETITVVIDEDGNVAVNGDTGSKEAVIGHVVNVENVSIEEPEPETVDVNGSKTWGVDSESGLPESVTIHLYADGEQVTDDEGNAVTVVATAEDGWTWSFTDLPKYTDNDEGEKVEIEYSVQEEYVSGYIPSYTYGEDGSITITNAIPEVHKYVSDPAFGESTDDLLHEDEADNSDTLEYRLEADHVGGAHNLVLHDLLDDQLDIDTLAVKSVTLYTGEGDEGAVLTEGTDYTVTTGACSAECGLDGCSFEIHVIDEDVEGLSADAYIIVIFDIEAAEGAGDFNENYVDEIDNWVGLSYTVYNALTGEEEPGYAPPDKTETYSYGFDLYKYDADSGEPLEGAEFVLSRESGDGIVYAMFDASEGTCMLSGWADSKDGATSIVTGSDGKAVVEGLHDGTFFIEETNAPEGYSQISETITVTITVSEDPESPTIEATNAVAAGLEVQVGNTPVIDETIDITGSKIWVGDDESNRPESVTICLYADGEQVTDEDGNAVTVTTTSDDGWEWTFTDLPKYTVNEDGEISETEYTVQEELVSGYIPSYTYGEDGSITITNAIPEVHKYVSDPAFGESTDDLLHEDEADNSDTLEYRLEADHVGGAHNLVLHDLLDDQLDIDTLTVKSVTLYTGEGDEGTVLTEGIDYTVTTGDCSAECGLEGCSFEIHVIDEDVEGLSADAYIIVIFDIEAAEGAGDFNESYVDEIDNWAGLSYTVYNALTGEEEPGYAPPDKTETYSYGFDLYKYDADSGEPLEGAEFVLSRESGDGIVYAMFDASEGTCMLSGWADSKDGATPIVTGSDGKAVVEGLHDGTFSIEETKAPEGYQQKTGTMTVTITVSEDDPADPAITATNVAVEGLEVQIENTMGETTEVIGSKTWVGDDENDRPDSITIYLYADGTQIDSVAVTADDNWAWSFSGLPVYQSDGETEIVYTILEGVVSGYIPTYSEDDLNVTNAIPEVHKYVSDPAFGESTDDLLHEDEADNSDTLEYRLEADHVGGAHNLVLHDWLDDQLDIDTLAVKSVTLYTGEGDEGTILEEGIDYTVTQGECSAECGLDGCSFEIHVIDEDVEGLSADAYIIVIFDIEAIEGAGDFNESYVDEIDNWVGLSYTVYNALTGEEEPGYAPPDKTETYSYGFDLYKYDADSGEPLEGVVFVLSKEAGDGTVYAVFEVSEGTYMLSGWTYSKDDATQIVTGSDGKAVVEGLHDGTFFIEETNAPEGYSQISETITVTITVSEDPESPTIEATNAIVSDLEVQIGNMPISEDMINITGSKTWNDSSDSFGSRPDSITIRLLADGVEVDSAIVTADDGWAWSFTDMPKYQEDGTTEINYTITEDAVNNYDTTYDGYNVINTFSPGSTSVTVLKLWDDDNDADGIRPDSITVVLEKNGEATDTTLTLSADNNWEGSFTGLAIYDQEADGSYSSTRNVYTVQEVSVEGYTTEILGDASSGYLIINTPTPDVETEPGPVIENPGSGTPDTQTGPGPVIENPGSGTPDTQTGPGPVVENPDTDNPLPTAKTSDPGLPILPLAGCCAAIALIASALVIRRRRAD